jgi:hypothetical protein
MGFTGYDAPFLTRVASRLRIQKNFSDEDKVRIQRIIRKYAEQIVQISDVGKLKIYLDHYYNREEEVVA